MAFWRFGLANESSIDTLLKDWSASSSISATESQAGQASTSASVKPSLEELLEEDDLLQEVKAGHSKLIDYFSSPYTIRRMLAYISGEAFDDAPVVQSAASGEQDAGAADPSPSRKDGTQQGEGDGDGDEGIAPPPVPPKDVAPSSASPASTEWRRESSTTPKKGKPQEYENPLSPQAIERQLQHAQMQRSDNDDATPEEQERARKQIKYPYLCMEILVMDNWQITDAIFKDTETYLTPFWCYILDKPSKALVDHSLQVGHWAKVNNLWLSGTRVTQMIAFLRNLPNLLPRMLVHLPYISPISDILNKLVNTDDAHPHLGIIAWLHEAKLVPSVLDLLDPVKSPIEAHTPAGEFLRGIVAAASAASASKQQQQQQQQAAAQSKFGQGSSHTGEIDSASLGLNGDRDTTWTVWPDNTLVRELASEATIKRLLEYMLDSRPVDLHIPPEMRRSRRTLKPQDAKAGEQKSASDNDNDDDMGSVPPTPTAASLSLSPLSIVTPSQDYLTSSSSSSLSTETGLSASSDSTVFPKAHEAAASISTSPSTMPSPSMSATPAMPSLEAATSSLLNALTLIIDIIRKNNSDFTELQILQYLERTNEFAFENDDSSDEEEKAANAAARRSHHGKEGEGEDVTSDHLEQGPSLVDLGPLLVNITRRLPELHQLLLYPRSNAPREPGSAEATPLSDDAMPFKAAFSRQSGEKLTFERFRICELYAELLHCSNMAILNRPPLPSQDSKDDVPAPTYDTTTGRILGTRKEALERLNKALQAQPPPSPSHGDPSVESNGVEGRSSNSGHGNDDDDDGMVEDISLTDGADEARPPTAASDVTSSYTSGASDGGFETNQDSEDVLEFLHATTDELSLDDAPDDMPSALLSASSAQNSPRPPSSFPNSPQITTPSSPPSASCAIDTFSKMPNTHKVALNGKMGRPLSLDKRKLELGNRMADKKPNLLPGVALKKSFVNQRIIPAVLDLFFKFPWNNFLHNVVYDLIQQIFNGKMDFGPNRELCIAVFSQDGGLVNRVLDAIDENKRICSQPHGVRLGHMGHMTLISEEIVKLFYNHPKDILPGIPDEHLDRARWEAYVEGSLRETRDRDLQPLGGGVSMAMHASASAGSGSGSGIGIIEADDEFPSSGASSKHFFAPHDDDDSPNTSPDKAHFARYLATQMSSDFPGTANPLNSSTSSSSSSGSSSSDDVADPRAVPATGTAATGLHNAAANWFSGDREGDSAFDDYDDDEDVGGAFATAQHHNDYDFGIVNASAAAAAAASTSAGIKPHVARQEKFGFDSDVFDPSRFGTGDSDDDEDDDGNGFRAQEIGNDDDDGFGPFSDSFAAKPSPAPEGSKSYSFDDDFGASASVSSSSVKVRTVNQQKLTPADWNSSFRSSFEANSPSATAKFQPSYGEFGDFSGSARGEGEADFDGDDDEDDFGDFEAAEDSLANQGDYDFTESHSLSPSAKQSQMQKPSTPHHALVGSPPERQGLTLPLVSPVTSPSLGPISPGVPGEEITGPGVHEGAHISKDGMHVEAEVEVDGETVTVQVPKDELALHPEMAQ